MRTILFAMTCFTVCLLCPSAKAQVNVYGYTDIFYDEANNTVTFSAQTYSDYTVQSYYCVGVTGYIYKDDEYQTQISGRGCASAQYPEAGYADAVTTLPYDPNAEYDIEAQHFVETYVSLTENEGGGGGYAGMDYYNFAAYAYPAPPIYSPLWFAFAGNGPPNRSTVSIILGQVFAVFVRGALSGPPDHLKIIDDNPLDPAKTDPVCGQKERQITYQVVDITGRSAGRNAVGENFPSTITSSCTGEEVSPSSCSSFFGGQFHPRLTDRKGKFTDKQKVGCPADADDCGFTIEPDTWVWCKPPDYTSNRVPLARIRYDVRKRSIAIGGIETKWPKDTAIYADGRIITP